MNVGPTARTVRLGSGFTGCGVSAGAAVAAPALDVGALAGAACVAAGAPACAGLCAARAGAGIGLPCASTRGCDSCLARCSLTTISPCSTVVSSMFFSVCAQLSPALRQLQLLSQACRYLNA